VESNGFGNF